MKIRLNRAEEDNKAGVGEDDFDNDNEDDGGEDDIGEHFCEDFDGDS